MKVSVVGHAVYDFICSVPRFPRKNTSIWIDNYEFSYGGAAANIAVGVKKLGCDSELIAAVGNDFDEYERYLKNLGIGLKLYRFKGKNPRAFIFNDESMDQITYFYWGVSSEIAAKEPMKCEIVHLAAGNPKFNLKMADECDFVAIDPGQDLPKYTGEELRELIEKSDMLFCNDRELRRMGEMIGIEAREIIEKFEKVIVTHGRKGSEVYSNGKIEKIPIVKSKILDPTGAGDAYRAGYWAGRLKGYSDVTSCKIGSTMASFAIEKIGAQTNLPAWELLTKRYEKFFGKIE
jgi:ribokinase